MTIQTALGLVGGIIGLVGFLGVVAVFLRGSADKGTMESQQRSITALETELGIEKDKTTRLEASLKACHAKVEALSLLNSHSVEIEKLQATADEILTVVKA